MSISIAFCAKILMIQILKVINIKLIMVAREPNRAIAFGIKINPRIETTDPAEYNNPVYDSGMN